jgi:hypothetical protein
MKRTKNKNEIQVTKDKRTKDKKLKERGMEDMTYQIRTKWQNPYAL